MHGLWGMGQMMFTKYVMEVDECLRTATNVHNTSEVLFRHYANTDRVEDPKSKIENPRW